jgi:hypothetical protein
LATIIMLGTTDKHAIAKATGRPPNTIKEHRTRIKAFSKVEHIDEAIQSGHDILAKVESAAT